MTDFARLPRQKRSFFEAPVFSEGFRVFFPLTALYALFSIVVWGLVLAGLLPMPFDADPLLFHQYEMFFGVGFAMQAGGLLELLPAAAYVSGQHMVFIGGLSLATFMVLIIAGLCHTGYSLKLPRLPGAGILALIGACLVRSLGPLVVPDLNIMPLAWGLFALAFTLYLIHFLPVFLR